MKHQLLLLPALLLLLHPHRMQAQIPFTYQGKLENSGSPFTGTVTLRLGLFPALEGFSALRTETIPDVSVSGGIFSVTPATFTAGDFPGAGRWLQIEVSNDGGGNYTLLTPRQRITHTPYAIYATQAGTAATVSGTIPASQLSGSLSAARLSSGTTTGTIHFDPAGGAPFSVGNAIVVPNLNSDLIDGLDSTAFLRTAGGSMLGNIGFGSTVRQMLNLWDTQYGVGVQADTLYQRSNSNFAWFKGGVHNDAALTPGAGGSALMTLRGTGDLQVTGKVNAREHYAITDAADARVVSGVHFSTTGTGVGLYGFSGSADGYAVLAEGADDGYGGKFTADGTEGWAVLGVSDLGFAGVFHGKVNATGATTLGSSLAVSGAATLNSSLAVSGATTLTNEVTTQGPLAGFALKNRDDQSKRWVMYSRNISGDDQLHFYSDTGGDVASLRTNGDLHLDGALSTTVLTIRGGADVAEPFEMTKPEEMAPGTVVVIDEDQPGQLKLSTESYDNKVAGIISGAGGVRPGLRLHQEGVMEGDHHVALSGRVYVKADAAFGKIKPGDLLTTSSTPGHAMKVKDHDKAQGTILGKAMSRLDEGTGLVLVLVTLQ